MDNITQVNFSDLSEADVVKEYVEGCLKLVSEQGLYLAGLQGGYIFPPEESLITDSRSIAYHYYDGKIMVPELTQIEEELSVYVDGLLLNCINNFSDFPYPVKQGRLDTTVSILADDVTVDINL